MNGTRRPLSLALFSTVLQVLPGQKQEFKRVQTGKEGKELSLFSDSGVTYRDNAKTVETILN